MMKVIKQRKNIGVTVIGLFMVLFGVLVIISENIIKGPYGEPWRFLYIGGWTASFLSDALFPLIIVIVGLLLVKTRMKYIKSLTRRAK